MQKIASRMQSYLHSNFLTYAVLSIYNSETEELLHSLNYFDAFCGNRN